MKLPWVTYLLLGGPIVHNDLPGYVLPTDTQTSDPVVVVAPVQTEPSLEVTHTKVEPAKIEPTENEHTEIEATELEPEKIKITEIKPAQSEPEPLVEPTPSVAPEPSVSSQAKQNYLVFGSFSSVTRAERYSSQVKTVLPEAEPEVHATGANQAMYRVMSKSIQLEELEALRQQAETANLEHWVMTN